LIKIIRAGLNPVDWKRATFAAREDFAFPGYIGVDGFGIVVAKGSKVSEEYVPDKTYVVWHGPLVRQKVHS
jgi:NADPH:quinone reductase-like Zn-dependent oxidoreductase